MKKSELRNIIRQLLKEQVPSGTAGPRPLGPGTSVNKTPANKAKGGGMNVSLEQPSSEEKFMSDLKALNLNLTDEQERGIVDYIVRKLKGMLGVGLDGLN